MKHGRSEKADSSVSSASSPPNLNSDGPIQQTSEPEGRTTEYKDALDAVISDAKRLPFLDEQDESSSKEAEEEDSDDERWESPRKKAPRTKKGQAFGFQCIDESDGSAKGTNPNKRTIEILSEMGDYYARMHDDWRSTSYRRAVATLRKQDKRVCFAYEAKKLPNIGDRLAEKIEEIVQTDQLKRLEYAKQEPGDVTLKLFLGVYGVGLKSAQQWVAKGHQTLQDLLDKENLTDSQRIGVNHHADFTQRIPRDEVRQHGDLVIKTAMEIDSELVLEIMGSYRRVCHSLETRTLCD
jgi:DNA polymerase IV